MSLERNFGLGEEEFDRLLDELKNGKETLFEEIFLKNFQDTCLYLKNKCNIHYDRAYDITMNTLLEFRIRLMDDKVVYGNLRFLFRQMAYHNFVKTVREQNKFEKFRSLKKVRTLGASRIDSTMFELLDKAYEMLSVGCRSLLDKFYFLGESYEQLAHDEDLSYGAIRKRKERCLSKLKELVRIQSEKQHL